MATTSSAATMTSSSSAGSSSSANANNASAVTVSEATACAFRAVSGGANPTLPLVNVKTFQKRFLDLLEADAEEDRRIDEEQRRLKRFREEFPDEDKEEPIFQEEIDLDVSNAVILPPEEQIEAAIAREVVLSKARSVLVENTTGERVTPQSLKNTICFDNIPTYNSIIESMKNTLESLTPQGKESNAKHVPRKEMNFVTNYMQQSTKLHHHPPPPPPQQQQQQQQGQHINAHDGSTATAVEDITNSNNATITITTTTTTNNNNNNNIIITTTNNTTTTNNKIEFLQVPPNEVVLSVGIYHPEKSTKTQEFLVLGSQFLTALRDEFYCLSDHILDGPKTKASAYFFIENTFYNDMRQEGNGAEDYSKEVLEWMNEEDRKKMRVRRMEEVRFQDLTLRIGERYLYCHQGNCMHFIVFNDMRLVHRQTDEQNANLYPVRTFQAKVRRRKCRICDIYPAKHVCYRDKLSGENPCFYCEYCYRPLHYSEEGVLLFDDFEVYPYHHE